MRSPIAAVRCGAQRIGHVCAGGPGSGRLGQIDHRHEESGVLVLGLRHFHPGADHQQGDRARADLVAGLKEDANWTLLDAVKNGKLYAFPLDFQSWDQPDTRWILGLTWMATKIQPDLFGTIKMYDEIPAFYADFYNLSKAEYNEKIQPILKGDF